LDKFGLETLLFLLIKYLHLVALLVLFSSAIAKYVLVVQDDTNQHKLHLARELGGASLIASIVMLVSGVMLVAWAGLSNSGYLANRFFLAKIAVFVLASIAVLVAKRFISRHSMERSYGWVQVPDYVRWLMRFDLAAVLVMVALALLMTHGFGARNP
jgi:uncharacterized membrane protein